MTRYLTLAEFFWLASEVTGLDPLTLTKASRVGLADSALQAPAAGFGDVDFYPHLLDKAAVLVCRLAWNHPLPDGNKRTAMALRAAKRCSERRRCRLKNVQSVLWLTGTTRPLTAVGQRVHSRYERRRVSVRCSTGQPGTVSRFTFRRGAAMMILLRRRSMRAAVVAFLLVGGLVCTGGGASASTRSPLVQQARPSMTADWWKTILSLPASANPFDSCVLGTNRLVYFSGTAGGTVKRSCTIDDRTRLLVPLINVECSTAEGNGNTPAELRACAAGVANDFADLKLVVDHQPVREFSRLRTQSAPFRVDVAAGNVFAIPPGVTLSVADGYWAVVGPFEAGTHHVSFGGTYPPGPFTTLAEYELTVTD